MFMALTTGSSTNLALTLVVISASLTTALAGLSVRWVQPPKAMAEPSSAAVMMDLAFIVVLLVSTGGWGVPRTIAAPPTWPEYGCASARSVGCLRGADGTASDSRVGRGRHVPVGSRRHADAPDADGF